MSTRFRLTLCGICILTPMAALPNISWGQTATPVETETAWLQGEWVLLPDYGTLQVMSDAGRFSARLEFGQQSGQGTMKATSDAKRPSTQPEAPDPFVAQIEGEYANETYTFRWTATKADGSNLSGTGAATLAEDHTSLVGEVLIADEAEPHSFTWRIVDRNIYTSGSVGLSPEIEEAIAQVIYAHESENGYYASPEGIVVALATSADSPFDTQVPIRMWQVRDGQLVTAEPETLERALGEDRQAWPLYTYLYSFKSGNAQEVEIDLLTHYQIGISEFSRGGNGQIWELEYQDGEWVVTDETPFMFWD